ncbi:YdiU family protein [Hymenobacter taeanensis]|uniref:Protein nucleotidyltransferase YdiU n=1 Tax=Hymenobacter taeanensis TaxID=2735321 RepID=A0A6M6BKC7_9BACT|nr:MULTISPECIES: YdiU family protein [Hymenobacter]QJX49081.1 YdiU family protein [Hymenobacter taeanensis]UOQ81397.1 YdiU family protein [Hymenobacter sp. 5414T-23]
MSIQTETQAKPLEEAVFQNSFVDELKGEASMNKNPRQVPGYHFSRVTPTAVNAPKLLAWSEELGQYLGLVRPPEQGPAVEMLAGNRVAESMKPFAARYGGHQFGNWAGQLGDGRAMSLGELTAVDGSVWEVQLKGAGPTPYSRRADGRAVLRSSIREFLCSEAMYHLGVPTTRALSLVATGDQVVRDMFYDGNARPEPGAIVARVAPTFVRFGNFQILLATGEMDNLRALADYVIRHQYPELGEPSPAVYVRWFEEICRRTAVMIAHWQSVGFVHGVMNTDNMSILGLTIDYGPYGWLEPYDLDWTPNTTDFGGRRYAFGQQPRVALWNLMQLGQAISPLVEDVQLLNPALDVYIKTLEGTRHSIMLAKLGLTSQNPEEDKALIEALEPALAESEIDMTIFFRRLSHTGPELLTNPNNEEAKLREFLQLAAYSMAPAEEAELMQWLKRYLQRLRQESASPKAIKESMLRANPKYVLRNYLAQQAIEAAETGDLSLLNRLMQVLKTPFDEQPEHEELAAKRPDWAREKPGSATLSCSS